jgi:hypothetical protein
MTAEVHAAPTAVPGRSCGTCTLCCKLLNVPEVEKPLGEWCRYCDKGVGCTIYADRPRRCRDFFCGYLQSANLSDEWHPVRARFLITREGDELTLYVDRAAPEAWTKPPYYGLIKHWARDPQSRLVLVRIGKRTIVVLPGIDVDLGATEPGDRIEWFARRGPQGLEYSARVVQRVSQP